MAPLCGSRWPSLARLLLPPWAHREAEAWAGAAGLQIQGRQREASGRPALLPQGPEVSCVLSRRTQMVGGGPTLRGHCWGWCSHLRSGDQKEGPGQSPGTWPRRRGRNTQN